MQIEIGVGPGETADRVWAILEEVGDASGRPHGWVRFGGLFVTLDERFTRHLVEEFDFRASVRINIVAPRGSDPRDHIRLLSAVAARTRADVIYALNFDKAMARRREGVWWFDDDLLAAVGKDALAAELG